MVTMHYLLEKLNFLRRVKGEMLGKSVSLFLNKQLLVPLTADFQMVCEHQLLNVKHLVNQQLHALPNLLLSFTQVHPYSAELTRAEQLSHVV